MQTDPSKALRKALEAAEFLTLPGIYDCLSARIAEEAGFRALFLSGGGLAYSRLGQPDIGFLNLEEFGSAIANITAAVSIPLIADADNGFGNAIHAANTARRYERLGASGIQLDDKILPSNRPTDDEVLSWELMGPKLKAARDAVSEDFVIIYRTVANLYNLGIDEAIERINRSAACGVDYAYVDGIRSMEELEKLSRNAEVKLMVNLNEKGFCGSVPIEEIRKYNFRMGLFPISSTLAAAQGMMKVMQALAETGSTLPARDRMCEPSSIYSMVGLKRLTDTYDGYYNCTQSRKCEG